MPCFPEKFARNIEVKKEKFQALFNRDPQTDEENRLKEEAQRLWNPLPISLPTASLPTFAIDGSGCCITLQGNRYLSIAQAVLQGKEWREVEVDVEPFKGVGSTDPQRFQDIHRQYLEWKLARENCQRMASSVLFLDGSIYIFPTLLYWAQVARRMPPGFEGFPLAASQEFLSLLNSSLTHNVILVGVAKHTLSHTYARLILQKDDVEITDSEMFSFWTRGKGFSTPVLLGPRAIPQPWEKARSMFLDSFPLDKREEASRILDGLFSSPGVVVFFLRFEENEEPYRVDVLASSLNISRGREEIEERGEFLDPALLEPILSLLLSSHGGFNVYHNLLYIAHQEVILRGRDEEIYLDLFRQLVESDVRRSRVDVRFGRRL